MSTDKSETVAKIECERVNSFPIVTLGSVETYDRVVFPFSLSNIFHQMWGRERGVWIKGIISIKISIVPSQGDKNKHLTRTLNIVSNFKKH